MAKHMHRRDWAIPLGILIVLGTGRNLDAQTHRLQLEATFFRASLGYYHRLDDSNRAGVEIGAGIPQIDVTWRPHGEDVLDILHVAFGWQRSLSPRLESAVQLRFGIADLYDCPSSDCLPGGYVGLSMALFYGGRHLRIGPRISGAGYYKANYRPVDVLWLSPLNGLAAYSW